jgi:hypothetical protein
VQELPTAEAERLIALDGLVLSDAGEGEIEEAEAAA